jgi:signal transduction histidine kinase
VGREIAAAGPEAVYDTLHRHVSALVDAVGVEVWAMEKGRLQRRYGMLNGHALPAARLGLDNVSLALVRSARGRQEGVLVGGAARSAVQASPDVPPMASALFLPLLRGGDLMGVLAVHSTRVGAYGERERYVARTLASYLVAALADGTDREELSEAQARLEHQKIRHMLVHAGQLVMVGRLAAGVAHEISHPVGSIRLLIENTRRQLQTGRAESAGDSIASIERELGRLLRLLGRLKNIARSEPPHLKQLALADVLADARALFTPRLRAENIEYAEEVQSATVNVDPEQLCLVIANIVFNAADAMQGSARRRILVSAVVEMGKLRLSIRDWGPGIPPHALKHLFEPFFTTKPQGEGLGLGLALSNESVEAMNGRLEAGNATGGGAVFTIVLPLAPRTGAGAPGARQELPRRIADEEAGTITPGPPGPG